MKKYLLCFVLFAGNSLVSLGQCDKNLVITSSKTEYLDASGNLQRTVDENTTIEITRDSIIISPNDKRMVASIKPDSCNWTTPYIEGKTSMKATFIDEQGNTKNATLYIEGKDGKLQFLMEPDDRAYMIRVAIDKFEEKK